MISSLITGEKGFLAKTYLNLYNKSNVKPLIYNRYTSYFYEELNKNPSEPHQIIHSGACSSRYAISINTYKDNYSSLLKLIEYVKSSPKSRIIYISANSIGSNEYASKFTDLYSYLKYQGELHIKASLAPDKYAIIRLPAIYERGVIRSGFLDKIVSAKPKTQLKIYSKNRFNNLITVEDACHFINKISRMTKLPGYIGCCGTSTTLKMSEIISTLRTYRPNLLTDIEYIESDALREEGHPVQTAINLGLAIRDLRERLAYLYK